MILEIDQSINLVSIGIGSNGWFFFKENVLMTSWITFFMVNFSNFVPVFTFLSDLNMELSKNETEMHIELIEQRILNETGLY